MAESVAAEAGRVTALRIDRTRRAPRRLRRGLLLALGLVTLAAVVAALLVRRPPVVDVAQVREARAGEALTELSAAGYVAAQRRSTIAPKVAGRLDEVLVSEGQQVAQGDILARLDDSDAKVALAQARAAAQGAAAQLATAEARAANSQRVLDRTTRLLEGGAATRESVVDAEAANRAAQAERRAAAARLAQARETVNAAQLGLDNTVVRAPFAGTIVRKLADEGAVLAPAALTDQSNLGGIVEMVDLGSLEVEAEVSEDQLSRIERGQPALIFLDAYPDRVYRALTGTVRPAIDRAKATAVVKVAFVDPPRDALPDMAAKVSFLEKPLSSEALEKEARLRVPASAVVQREGGAVVLTVDDGGRLKEVPVRVERKLGNEVSLSAGPAAGTRIVATPGRRLRDGGQVRVQAEGS